MNSRYKPLFSVLFSRRIFVAFLMGFSCGLPLLLTMGVLQAWMKEEGVDLGLIGLIALVQLPYTWKFLWAPILDRFIPPFLGRRRGWLLLAQIGTIAAIAGLGFSDPARHIWATVGAALLTAFFSATQDIVVDAYRREDLADEELGLGSSLYIYGYRIGMLLASGGGLILADHMPFSMVYLVMAACMLPGVLTTFFTPEPVVAEIPPRSLREAVVDPLMEFFSRDGAVLVLTFILLYKIGDTMASAITMPFYLDVGFTKTEIGTVVKLFGFWAVIGGAFLGGLILLKIGINRSLWMFGVLQALSTACFAVLARIGPSTSALAGVITFENISSGMGTAAFTAYMASLTNKRFTATQYALLTSLMAIPRSVTAALTGYMVKGIGWETFFIACAIIAIPGMVLLVKVAPWERKAGFKGSRVQGFK